MSAHGCPCCGAPMLSVPAKALTYAALTPRQREIVSVLAEVYPRRLSARQISDRVYALDPNGGPLTANNAVSVHIHRMRETLRGLGWHIGADGRNGIGLSPVGAAQ